MSAFSVGRAVTRGGGDRVSFRSNRHVLTTTSPVAAHPTFICQGQQCAFPYTCRTAGPCLKLAAGHLRGRASTLGERFGRDAQLQSSIFTI